MCVSIVLNKPLKVVLTVQNTVIEPHIENADPLSKTSVSSCSASDSDIASISLSCNRMAKFGGTSVFCKCNRYNRNLCSTVVSVGACTKAIVRDSEKH